MKSRFLQLFSLLTLATPAGIAAQGLPATDPRNIHMQSGGQQSGTPSTGGQQSRDTKGITTFKAGADRLVASGELTDRLVSDEEWIKKYAATITALDLEAHLRFLASDELEGRETGARGQKVAARYLSTQFMKMGLLPGNKGEWYQSYNLNRLMIDNAKISLAGKEELEIGEGFVCFDKGALARQIAGDYAFAGYGIDDKKYDNLKGLDLKGKIAIVLAGEPMTNGKSLISGTEKPSAWGEEIDLKMEAISKKGAAAALVVLSDVDYKRMASSPWIKRSMSNPSLRLAYKDEENPAMAEFYISETTANALFKKAKTSVQAQKVALNNSAEISPIDLSKYRFVSITQSRTESVVAENVLGFIEGTDKKDEVVVITAHFDHLGIQDGVIYNGADDDGTGTVALLEIAEAFMAAVNDGHRPRRSILFMPVSGEEKGLLGSEYYSDHPVYPLTKTVCDLNIDMIGRVDEKHKGEPQYIYVIGSDKLSTQLHVANESANKVLSNLELDYTFNSPDDPNQFYYRSDHYNFAKHGIPVIFYFSGVHEDYHKPTDDVDKILFPRAMRVAQLVFTTAWEAANRQEKLVVDKQNDFKER